jgi:hypothetical protein
MDEGGDGCIIVKVLQINDSLVLIEEDVMFEVWGCCVFIPWFGCLRSFCF